MAIKYTFYGKNRLNNGDFYLCQRVENLSQFLQGYVEDRWYNHNDAGYSSYAEILFSKELGLTYSRTSIFTLGSGVESVYKSQRIEDMIDGTYSVSFYARADTPKYIATYVNQYYDSDPSDNQLAPQLHTVTTNWQKFYYTFTLPSLAGKVIGITPYSEFVLCLAGGLTDHQIGYIDLTGIALEEGSSIPYFESNIVPNEIACMRYYQKSYDVGTPAGTITSTGALQTMTKTTDSMRHGIGTSLPVVMRIQPSITTYSPLTGEPGKMDIGSTQYDSSAIIEKNHIFIRTASNVALSMGQTLQVHYTLDSEL